MHVFLWNMIWKSWRTAFFVHERSTGAVKTERCVSDRMSYILQC